AAGNHAHSLRSLCPSPIGAHPAATSSWLAAARLHPEVPRVRVMQHQRRDAGLGVHHVALGQLDADLLGAEDREELALEGEVRAGRVAEAVALAAVARGERLLQGHLRRTGEAPTAARAGGQL